MDYQGQLSRLDLLFKFVLVIILSVLPSLYTQKNVKTQTVPNTTFTSDETIPKSSAEVLWTEATNPEPTEKTLLTGVQMI